MLVDRIPKEDKCCINCVRLGRQAEGGSERLCCGEWPCSNYADGNKYSFFWPDDDYLETRFGCEACAHRGQEDYCENCSKNYESQWERGDA